MAPRNAVRFHESVSERTFKDAIGKLKIKPPVLIKPNWGCSAFFTEAQILDWALSAIEGEKLVVESYGWARTEEYLTTRSFGSKTKSALRRSDRWFLDHTGIRDVLSSHDVEFLNITEEKWAGRLADAGDISSLVARKYSPVALERMYSEVPKRLFDMRGGTLLSLAKLRFAPPPYGVSFTVKNLFGMIPGPGRYSPYHGKKDCNLAQSVLDINKIYRSMFDVKGVIDGVLTAEEVDWTNHTSKIHSGLGLLWSSENTIELDTYVASQFDRDPSSIGYLVHTAKGLGLWSHEVVRKAETNKLTHLLSG